MKTIYLYNTLDRKKEEFKPIKKGELGLYTCGPTVYNHAHIGNLRTYLFEDFLKRMFLYNDYKVKHVMNITDVGHLVGDGDMGEDKLELGAKREQKSAWEIADYYFKAFVEDLKYLNIIEPNKWYKATGTIKEQINLIKILEEKGYTYEISDGIYFDTSKVGDYNKLSKQKLEDLKDGARVEKNQEKRNITDFALWKFSPQDKKRQMEWQSPWGLGFPGWHIECSTMSLKGLGKQLDIHCGGMDHINVHHTNEIAQSEAATGHKFFNYWLHGAFMNIAGGKKMAKSENNFLTLQKALLDKNINPLAFRLAALQVHYRKPMEYSPDIIDNAYSALKALYQRVQDLESEIGRVSIDYKDKFITYINNDLNTAQALALAQTLLRDKDLSKADKLATILDFDKFLGLDIKKHVDKGVPRVVEELAKKRQIARKEKDFAEADNLRKEIVKLGYEIKDGDDGYKLKKK
ncbi:MAG TPA: cysteine--tRNA ligase [Patescibacteria group bacterium]|nr:cysteine--tRNA ligase [Patescibacteria group bacterium]